MTTIDTARLRALAEAATPGKRSVAGSRILVDNTLGAQAWGPNWRNDQAFIAAADPQAMLALLDEIERLRGEGEWEYAWAGEDWLLEDEVFPSPQVAENWVGLLSTRRWVREEGGYLVRRRAAGPWEPVEGDGDA